MKDQNCIFCKIAAREMTSDNDILYENEYVIAFPDINPSVPGHTILIPKEHYTWFYEVPGDIANELFAAAQNLALELKDEYNADFVELKIIGVDIPHTHIHLLPRKKN